MKKGAKAAIGFGVAGLGFLVYALTKKPPALVYTCPVCGATFPTQAALNEHIASEHPEVTPYVCPVCGQTFTTQAELDAHIASAHPEEPQGVAQISDLKVSPETIMLGGEVRITYKITNIGPEGEIGDIAIKVNDVVIASCPTLWYEPGDWYDDLVRFTPEEAGSYTVEVDGNFAYFTVTPWQFPDLTTKLPVAPQGARIVRAWLETYKGYPEMGIGAEVEITMGSILDKTVQVTVGKGSPYLYACKDVYDRSWAHTLASAVIDVPPGLSTFTFTLSPAWTLIYVSRHNAWEKYRVELNLPVGVIIQTDIRCTTLLTTPIQIGESVDEFGNIIPIMTNSKYSLKMPASFETGLFPGAASRIVSIEPLATFDPTPNATLPVRVTYELRYWKGDAVPTARVSARISLSTRSAGGIMQSGDGPAAVFPHPNCGVGVYTVDLIVTNPTWTGFTWSRKWSVKVGIVVDVSILGKVFSCSGEPLRLTLRIEGPYYQ